MISSDDAISIDKVSKYFHLKKWRGISKSFNDDSKFCALKNVSFKIKKGEAVALIGKNGSGKSTILQAIAGTMKPTEGRIFVDGKVAALLELGSGFNQEFTGRENVYLNGSILGIDKKSIDEKFEKIKEFSGIGDFIEQPVKTYSSGMLVRLAFSVMINVDADILIIDEALAVGDALFTHKCMRFIEEFKKNKTLIFVSHDLAAVSKIAERVIWLNDGSVAYDGDVSTGISMYHKYILGHEVFEPVSEDLSVQELTLNTINPDAEKTSDGTFEIISGAFLSSNQPLFLSHGAEEVNLLIKFVSQSDTPDCIVGFSIKDKHGQKIVEDNAFNLLGERFIDVPKGIKCSVTFSFKLPELRSGNYSIDFAIGKGFPEACVINTWCYDAFQFEVVATKNISGVIGLRDVEISEIKYE